MSDKCEKRLVAYVCELKAGHSGMHKDNGCQWANDPPAPPVDAGVKQPFKVVKDGDSWMIDGPTGLQYSSRNEQDVRDQCVDLNAAYLAGSNDRAKRDAEIARTTPFRKGEWLKANEIIARAIQQGGNTNQEVSSD